MRALINASINITKTKDSRILKKKKKKRNKATEIKYFPCCDHCFNI